MKIVDQLRNYIQAQTIDCDSDRFMLRGIWYLDFVFRPRQTERLFKYRAFIAQAEQQGACYIFDDASEFSPRLLGRDTRYEMTNNNALDIAILDAAFGSLDSAPNARHFLTGSAASKAIERATVIANEAERLLAMRLDDCPHKIAMVGVVWHVVEKLKQNGHSVLLSDLDPELIGHSLNGELVDDGTVATIANVERSAVAIITGMTLATRTLESILAAAKRSGTAVVLVAETGASFAEFYCKHLGVDAVVSEPFPFYIFSGHTVVNVYRRAQEE